MDGSSGHARRHEDGDRYRDTAVTTAHRLGLPAVNRGGPSSDPAPRCSVGRFTRFWCARDALVTPRSPELGALLSIGCEPPRVYPVRVDALPSAEFAWRVTAANGRALGRSAKRFATAADTLAALDALILRAGGQPLSATIGHRPGGWGWTLLDQHGEPIAYSPRTFERRGSCARSLDRFRSAITALAVENESATRAEFAKVSGILD